MSFQLPNTRPVSSSERVNFHCKRCGACCRHVRETVPLDTLDAWRLAKYLRGRGEPIDNLDTVFAKYTEPVILHESGFSMFMLKSTGPDDACIFLKDNRCTIQQAKPRACRLYPFSVEPTPDGRYKFLLSLERGHHFKGGQVQIGRWMKQNFLPEDKEFMRIDMGFAPQIALLLGKTPDAERKRAIIMYLWYKFSDYDLGKPFLEQYRTNISLLISQLQKLVKTEEHNGR